MGVITFTSCFIQNFTNASYFSVVFLGFKVRRKKKKQINEISLMSLYLKIHPKGRPVFCWSMIQPARIVVLIAVCSPFSRSRLKANIHAFFYTRCQLDVTNSGPGLFGTAANAEWLFSRFNSRRNLHICCVTF